MAPEQLRLQLHQLLSYLAPALILEMGLMQLPEMHHVGACVSSAFTVTPHACQRLSAAFCVFYRVDLWTCVLANPHGEVRNKAA